MRPFSVLSFRPHFDPEFSPLGALLTRGEKTCPVIIERYAEVHHASQLPDSTASAIRHFLSRPSHPNKTPFILLMRTLDGQVQAHSCNTLVSFDGYASMQCDSAAKLDQDSAAAIQNVGLAFLLARLNYMKQHHWPEHRLSTILSDFIPQVLNSYRLAAGLEPSSLLEGLGMESLIAAEGDRFLTASPIHMITLTSPTESES